MEDDFTHFTHMIIMIIMITWKVLRSQFGSQDVGPTLGKSLASQDVRPTLPVCMIQSAPSLHHKIIMILLGVGLPGAPLRNYVRA